MTRSVLYAEHSWPEVERLVEGGAPVFLPLGATEQHGRHMALNVDVVLPKAIAARAATRVGGLVLPAIAYGNRSQPKTGGGRAFPGTLNLTAQAGPIGFAGSPFSISGQFKLVRDATGRTGLKLFRGVLLGWKAPDQRARHTAFKIYLVQAVMIAAAVLSGHWWVYPVLWLAPFLTVWRVINRLRSIAEHGGMKMSTDRRETTHSVAQSIPARLFLVPYCIGWHLAHHVDSGVPFRNLPRYHRALQEAGYVDASIEYSSYIRIWRALAAG